MPFLLGIAISHFILPRNCYLFGNPDGPLSCDTINNFCCPDMLKVRYAQLIFGLGAMLSIFAGYCFTKREFVEGDNRPMSITGN
jgi:hypothetical protein